MVVLGTDSFSAKAVLMRVIPAGTLGLLLIGFWTMMDMNNTSKLRDLGRLRFRCGRQVGHRYHAGHGDMRVLLSVSFQFHPVGAYCWIFLRCLDHSRHLLSFCFIN